MAGPLAATARSPGTPRKPRVRRGDSAVRFWRQPREPGVRSRHLGRVAFGGRVVFLGHGRDVIGSIAFVIASHQIRRVKFAHSNIDLFDYFLDAFVRFGGRQVQFQT